VRAKHCEGAASSAQKVASSPAELTFKGEGMNAYSGKRLNQNEKKVKAIKKRERRLNKIGLSLNSFSDPTFPWLSFFKNRNEQRQSAK
jgi:hypothetical protein